MHVRDIRVFSLMPLLQNCIDQCEVFVAEYDLNESLKAAGPLAGHIQSPVAWADQLRPEKFQKIRRIILKTTGVDIHHYRQLLPFFIVQQLTAHMMPQEESMPLDVALWTYAEKKGKALAGLETFEGQLNFIRRIPVDKQVKMLVDFARHPASIRKHYAHLMKLYLAQDIYRLHRSMKKKSGHFRKVLLYERNFTMAGGIGTFCRQQPTFVAVGAGHLTGGKGLIRLLRQQGIKVKAVSAGPLPQTQENSSQS